MHLQSFARWAVRLSALTVSFSVLPALADENSDHLGKGVQSCEQGDYLGAQDWLSRVDRSRLNEGDQTRYDAYVQRVGQAIEMMEKAASDLEKADTQLGTGRTDEASRLYHQVLDNSFAHESMKTAAQQGLNEIARRQAQRPSHSAQEAHQVTATDVQSTPESAPMTVRKANFQPAESPADAARRLTREAAEAAGQGRDDVAEHLYQSALEAVPGYPEAVQGLESLKNRRGVEASQSGDLISRLRERDRVNWERAVSAYREAERETRDLVLDGKFNLARQTLLRAGQIVESSKQYADPVAKYDTLRNELTALERYLEAEETRTEEDEVRSTRREVEKTEQARILEVEDARRAELDALLEQAMSLRKDGDYPGAIRVLEQVVAIDPTDQQASALLDSWIDVYSLRMQREHRRNRGVETQGLLEQVEADKIPINEELRYPKNWREIVSRTDTRTATGLDRLSAEDVALQARLDERYAVNFDETPLEDVLDKMADDRHINVNVVWNDLEAAGIERDAPVSIALANEIPFRRALDEVLDVVGGGTVRLGYTAQGGVVKVATRTYLDREVFTGVYNITDLLQPLKNFTDGPTIDLAQQNQGGGGGGGGIGQTTGQIFDDGQGGEEDDEEDDAEREERVEQILELIRSTIQFDTWRENGGPVANIAEFNGQLVVTQTASAHQEIKDLLAQLREQSSIQVAVEAIFLQINSNYLEELGIDLDVVLNNGNAGFDQTGAVDSVTGSQLLLPRSFSRVGFIPAVPGVGQSLTATGFTQTGGPTGVPGQPFDNPVLVPGRGTNFMSSSQTTPFPVQNNILDLVSPQSTDVEGSFGGSNFQPAINIFGSFLDNIQVDFLLRATQADRRSTVMSAPRVTMTNGQRSWVGVVTQEAYVATLQPVLDENAAAVQPVIGLIETGAVLDVESTVSADKHYVTMTLRPGVGRLVGDVPIFPFGLSAGGAGFAGFIQTPTVQRQILKTTVTVPDGGTLLFGGLKLAAEVEVDAGVPILSKIPVLKNLYSARSLVKDESVLLILVKPKIIINREAEREAFPDLAGR